MKNERQSFDEHIRDVFDHTRPRRSRFTQTERNDGSRRNKSIIDNTGVIAANVLVSGLVNGMSSPAQPWFKFEPDDLELLEYGPVKDWLGLLERLVRRIFHASNVYEALPVVYDELILAGTGAAIVDDDFDDVIRMHSLTWGEYAIALNQRRTVDTLYRETSMTVNQVVQAFGLKNLSTTVRTAYDNGNYDQWVTVMHAIEPNPERAAGKLDNKNMAWRSVYWEANNNEKDTFLRKSGYRVNPIIAPRWSVIGNDIYGSSPGMEALGDMRQLQIQQKRKGEAIEKLVRPPTQGPTSLADKFFSQLPGAHTPVADPANGIRPIFEVRPDLNQMVADIEDTRRRIQETFFVPYILSISSMEGVQPKNQWEIAERKGEGLLVLGPAVQRLQAELHNPLIARVINRVVDVCMPYWQLGEAGMLPPPPPELSGMPLQIQYISSLAQVQKATALSGMERLLMVVTNPQVAQSMPDILDKIDAQQWVDEFGENLGVPARVIRSDEVVAQMQQERQQQQQMQQLAALAQPAKDAAQAAKAMSEAKVEAEPGEGKGALQAMMEGVQDANESGEIAGAA